MKQIKKVMALVLALAMVMGTMSLTAFAADPDGSITVDNAINDEEYTLYKVFDLTYGGSGETGATGTTDTGATAGTYSPVSYTYTADGSSDQFLAALQGSSSPFTVKADPVTSGKYSVVRKNGVTDTAIIEFIKSNISKLPTGKKIGTKTAASNKVEWTNLAYGYYYVTSTAGSFVTIDSTIKDVTVKEKNTIPSVDKKEKTSGDSYVDGPVDAQVGDTVHYQVEITDGKGTNNDITLTDTMTAGLDYTAGSIKINGTAVADDADTDNWKVTVNGRTITILFKAAYVATVDTGAKITVTYDATINKNAVVDDNDANENKAKIEYSHQSSEDKVYVETYDFIVKKTDGSQYLPGAGFKLYDKQTGGNLITVGGADDTGYYVDATADEIIMVDNANGVNVRGLAPGTYYLEEVVTPEGYNPLSARQEITVTSGQTAAAQVTVVNQKGTELPSTGGIGTTIFYILGAGLVIGAVVMLVARKKAEKKAE